MEINIEKTELMVIAKQETKEQVSVNKEQNSNIYEVSLH
jgi:hypothetical protein